MLWLIYSTIQWITSATIKKKEEKKEILINCNLGKQKKETAAYYFWDRNGSWNGGTSLEAWDLNEQIKRNKHVTKRKSRRDRNNKQTKKAKQKKDSSITYQYIRHFPTLCIIAQQKQEILEAIRMRA